jgi:Uma2 family endonuclease
MPTLRQRRWTAEELDQLVEERPGLSPRYELADGELLVTPAPTDRHQRIVGAIFLLLTEYTRGRGIGEVRLGPARARVSPETRFGPDVFVVASLDGRRPRSEAPVTPLALVVEVVSPGSARHDRITKRRQFLSHGLPEFWVVDGDAETFEVWRSNEERPALVDRRLLWQPALGLPPFELNVAAFFLSVADD